MRLGFTFFIDAHLSSARAKASARGRAQTLEKPASMLNDVGVQRRKYYVLIVLTLIGLFGAVDKVALAILLQDIKLEFDLSDTQLGLMTGITFAIFYALMGIPIARWADRGNRITIISLATALWSTGIALCGVATNFVQLLSIRIGVAIGEAGVLPPSFSLLADYFPRSERARAISVYGLAGTASSILGFAAGWLNEYYGWRITLIVLAVPGLLLALLARLTIRETRATAEAGVSLPRDTQPSLWTVLRILRANPSFLHMLMFLSVVIFFTYGTGQWMPIFFYRSFEFSTAQVGGWFAVVYTTGGLFGALAGGEFCTRFAANNEKLQLKTTSAALAICALVSVGIYLSPSPYVSLALMGVMMFGFGAVSGPLIASIQGVVPDNMRAIAFALAYLVANLIGMGVGPLAAGVLSDAFQRWLGSESVRFALLALSPGYLWAAWHAWRASVTVANDMAAADARNRTSATASPEPGVVTV